MNRIPVVNDEQRDGYGAPTTDVDAGEAPAGPETFGEEMAAMVDVEVAEFDQTEKPAAPAKKKKSA